MEKNVLKQITKNKPLNDSYLIIIKTLVDTKYIQHHKTTHFKESCQTHKQKT